MRLQRSYDVWRDDVNEFKIGVLRKKKRSRIYYSTNETDEKDILGISL